MGHNTLLSCFHCGEPMQSVSLFHFQIARFCLHSECASATVFGNYLEEYQRWHALVWGGPAGDCPSADNFITHLMQGPLSPFDCG